VRSRSRAWRTRRPAPEPTRGSWAGGETAGLAPPSHVLLAPYQVAQVASAPQTRSPSRGLRTRSSHAHRPASGRRRRWWHRRPPITPAQETSAISPTSTESRRCVARPARPWRPPRPAKHLGVTAGVPGFPCSPAAVTRPASSPAGCCSSREHLAEKVVVQVPPPRKPRSPSRQRELITDGRPRDGAGCPPSGVRITSRRSRPGGEAERLLHLGSECQRARAPDSRETRRGREQPVLDAGGHGVAVFRACPDRPRRDKHAITTAHFEQRRLLGSPLGVILLVPQRHGRGPRRSPRESPRARRTARLTVCGSAPGSPVMSSPPARGAWGRLRPCLFRPRVRRVERVDHAYPSRSRSSSSRPRCAQLVQHRDAHCPRCLAGGEVLVRGRM